MRRVIFAMPLAALALAGCGSTAATPAAKVIPAKPLTCKQQYDAWKTGPARTAVKKLEAALKKVETAGDDIPALASALKKAGPPAARSARYPMPSCADPHGYWNQLLTRVRAASDNAKSASGLGAIILAEVPLKDVPGIEKKLTAELKRDAAKAR